MRRLVALLIGLALALLAVQLAAAPADAASPQTWQHSSQCGDYGDGTITQANVNVSEQYLCSTPEGPNASLFTQAPGGVWGTLQIRVHVDGAADSQNGLPQMALSYWQNGALGFGPIVPQGGSYSITLTQQSGIAAFQIDVFGPGAPAPSLGAYISVSAIWSASATQPTATPTVTNTPVPSTPTPTITPGGPTLTPTPTNTATSVATATPTPSPTPINCGDWTFPLLNCNLAGGTGSAQPFTYPSWSVAGYTGLNTGCDGWYMGATYIETEFCTGSGAYEDLSQNVVVPAAGTLYVVISSWTWLSCGCGTPPHAYMDFDNGTQVDITSTGTFSLGHISSAGTHSFHLRGTGQNWIRLTLSSVYVTQDSPISSPTATGTVTNTPTATGTATATPTQPLPGTPILTSTPRPTPGAGTATWTVTPTLVPTWVTPVPYPSSTIAAPTPCGANCSLTVFTPTATGTFLPTPGPGTPTWTPSATGTATATPCPLCPTAVPRPSPLPQGTIGPDISGLSALYGLSLTRPACTPLGHLPVFVPSLVQTSVFSYTMTIGTTTTLGPPIQTWWSLPTGPGGTDITQISPCTQLGSSFTWFWDFLYYLQVVLVFIAFIFYQLRRFAWGAFSDTLAT